jgi:hypothetical protein
MNYYRRYLIGANPQFKVRTDHDDLIVEKHSCMSRSVRHMTAGTLAGEVEIMKNHNKFLWSIAPARHIETRVVNIEKLAATNARNGRDFPADIVVNPA